MCVCVRVCVCVRACVRACVRVCVCVCVLLLLLLLFWIKTCSELLPEAMSPDGQSVAKTSS